MPFTDNHALNKNNITWLIFPMDMSHLLELEAFTWWYFTCAHKLHTMYLYTYAIAVTSTSHYFKTKYTLVILILTPNKVGNILFHLYSQATQSTYTTLYSPPYSVYSTYTLTHIVKLYNILVPTVSLQQRWEGQMQQCTGCCRGQANAA